MHDTYLPLYVPVVISVMLYYEIFLGAFVVSVFCFVFIPNRKFEFKINTSRIYFMQNTTVMLHLPMFCHASFLFMHICMNEINA